MALSSSQPGFDPDQDAYIRLREVVSERTHRLMIWCGAGLSVPAGLPDWSGLRSALSAALQRKTATLSDRNPAEVDALIRTIAAEQNPWVAIQRLQREVGQTTYCETIREALRAAASARIPESYKMLWKLRPSGLLNLCLDRLATRAFHDVNGAKTLAEFDGAAIGAHTHVLRSPSPFVCNLHGTAENTTSWVLTYDELQALLKADPYTNFVNSVLSTSTVFLVGLSADEIAVGGHLERLAKSGIHTGTHYWASSRTDEKTDRWAEAAGIRVIRYRAVGGTHSALEDMLNDLLTFVPPEDPPAPPVAASLGSLDRPLPTPEELSRQDAESIRVCLNRRACDILAQDNAETFAAFERFAAEYDEPIYRAWFTSLEAGKNQLLGYTLLGEATSGAFGHVFRAMAPDGAPVAIKLLHNEMRGRRPLLLAFRRGVRSLSILSKRHVSGVVPFRAASEIPATVVMDWVEGANLKDAVLAKRLQAWPAIIKVARELSTIIQAAHAVPERVLHRDIRPPNIMLEGFWSGDDWRVVVLDFDLSWHREAFEQSVIHGSGTAGYLAPEQFTRIPGVSTRHASVDSFGLGMTFYFILSGQDPVPAQHRHKDWEADVRKHAASHDCVQWRSLPGRFARMVLGATRDRQAERFDVGQIVSEIRRLEGALDRPDKVGAADMIAEEIAANAECMAAYTWSEDHLSADVTRPSGLALQVRGLESERRIAARLTWQKIGVEDRRRVGKWIPDAARSAAAAMSKGPWAVQRQDASTEAMSVEATYDLIGDRVPIHPLAVSLDHAAAQLRFE